MEHGVPPPITDLPCPMPLPEAVAAGVFGETEDPDEDAVRAITEEHAREMIVLLWNVSYLGWCKEYCLEPKTRKRPREMEARERLERNIDEEIQDVRARYQDCIHVYAEGFGLDAADALDACVRRYVHTYVSHEVPVVQKELF